MDPRTKSANQRRAETSAIEGQAKFWRGYEPATTWLIKANPRVVRCGGDGKPRKVSVYFVRFRSKTNPTYSFLKIGITNSIKERFGFDSHRYDMEILATTLGMTRAEASMIEARLHKKFAGWSHKPQIPLMSKGDTECFCDDGMLHVSIIAEFRKLRNVTVGLPEIDKRIYQVLRLLNPRHPEPQSLIDAFRGNMRNLGVKNIPSAVVLLDYYYQKIQKLD